MLWLLSALAWLGPGPATAETARWVEGLPPVEMAKELGLELPRYAELRASPELEAQVFVLRGEKRQQPFSALVVVRGEKVAFTGLGDVFVPGRVIQRKVAVDLPEAPAQQVFLELRGDSRPLLWYRWSKAQPKQVGSLALGEPFPGLEARGLDGAHWSPAELNGRVTVLYWWSTEAPPCVDEIPTLNELFDEFGSDRQVRFYAVSPQGRKVIEAFVAARPFRFSQLVSANGRELFGGSYPRYVVLDAGGRVVFDLVGWVGEGTARLRAAIRAALAEADASPSSSSS